jgi:hypothetical protein
MTAQIIKFVPRPNPNREAYLQHLANEVMNVAISGQVLEQQAKESVAMGEPVVLIDPKTGRYQWPDAVESIPNGGIGIDGLWPNDQKDPA